MKALKMIAPLFVLGVGLSGVASAQTTMNPETADNTAVKVRQVTYQCNIGGTTKVTYGFNRQNLPTYAEMNLGGKSRFLPINLERSDIAGTYFGNDDSWQIGTDVLTLGNYHKSDVIIHSPAAETAYKGCHVVKVKRIKG
ncbi:adhesin [Moraxella nasovis]|uniref:ACP-like domain-containing protein n=1 Tax=Moraxella nasovis TaxID=2904121 RepID=UPI001F614F21|nr:adhesin [Moraxella nasovis]UNU74237.1 adhesin [Moraxella nasovis]